MADLELKVSDGDWTMDNIQLICKWLGFTVDQLEAHMLNDYLQWCLNKSYIPSINAPKISGSLALEVSTPDLQNLLADAVLFNYFKKMYTDCMLDFLEDVAGYKDAEITKKDALRMYKNCILNCFRFYNTDLLNQARNKKIIHHVRN